MSRILAQYCLNVETVSPQVCWEEKLLYASAYLHKIRPALELGTLGASKGCVVKHLLVDVILFLELLLPLNRLMGHRRDGFLKVITELTDVTLVRLVPGVNCYIGVGNEMK